MLIYNENGKDIYDNDGLAYVVEIGYVQMVFNNHYDAVEYAKTTAQKANMDISVKVVRRIDQYTGEVIVDE